MKKSKALKFLKENWSYLAVAPVIYGFFATWINYFISGEYFSSQIPFPSFWFAVVGENFGLTGFYILAIIGTIGGFSLLYKGYKNKKDRWINLTLSLITLGWEAYVWFLLNSFRGLF